MKARQAAKDRVQGGVIINTKQLTEKEELQFIRLAKMAGFTIKQIEQEVTLSTESLNHKWKKIPVKRIPQYLKVHNRHKGMIIELILMSIDIFEISSIFNYSPITVLRFIERASLEAQWRIRKCDVCKHPFVDFERRKICQRMSCNW
ncbi:MAG: hypothetical protein ACE5FZ_09640, partial [Nitrospiria bacterium]